jgi:hypothetical protein
LHKSVIFTLLILSYLHASGVGALGKSPSSGV